MFHSINCRNCKPTPRGHSTPRPTVLRKPVWRVLKKPYIELSRHLVTPHFSIRLPNPCTRLPNLTGALFMTAKKWKQHKHLDKWTKKYMHTMEYQWVIKRNKHYDMDKTWKHYAVISQALKVTNYMVPFIWNVPDEQIHKDRKQVGNYRAGWGGNVEWLLMSTSFPSEVLERFWNCITMGIAGAPGGSVVRHLP